MFQAKNLKVFASELCDVVGDLHDNVWAHGMATGYSMAQIWKPDSTEYIEFGLADCGMGFRRELLRAGVGNSGSDREAIDWCLKSGNSSKNKPIDEWAQRLPEDAMGNPAPGVFQQLPSGNHHQGLGLGKLVALVKRHRGKMWVSSGSATCVMDGAGKRRYFDNRVQWPGVAVACRFDTSGVRSVPAPDQVTQMIADIIGGHDELQEH